MIRFASTITLRLLQVLTLPQVVNAPHKAALSHELIAAAASYEVGIIAALS